MLHMRFLGTSLAVLWWCHPGGLFVIFTPHLNSSGDEGWGGGCWERLADHVRREQMGSAHPSPSSLPSPGEPDAEEALPSGLPPTFIRFAHHSYAQMARVLKRTAARCPQVAKTYSIGRSFEGKDLLVIEFSSRPGQHELSE